jgi:hypothetical protein
MTSRQAIPEEAAHSRRRSRREASRCDALVAPERFGYHSASDQQAHGREPAQCGSPKAQLARKRSGERTVRFEDRLWRVARLGPPKGYGTHPISQVTGQRGGRPATACRLVVSGLPCEDER